MSRSLVGSSSTSTLAGQREQARQQHAVALAAGERAHRRVGALGREQEVVQVAHHVLRAVPISIHAAGADGVGQRRIQVERAAHLVEVGDLQPRGPWRTVPAGRSSPRMSLSSVVLPAPLGPIRPTLSPRRMVALKSLTTACRRSAWFTSLSSATIFPLLGTPLSTSSRTCPSDSRLPRCARRPRAAGCAPRCACGVPHAFADPHLLLRQQLVARRWLKRLGGELLSFTRS